MSKSTAQRLLHWRRSDIIHLVGQHGKLSNPLLLSDRQVIIFFCNIHFGVTFQATAPLSRNSFNSCNTIANQQRQAPPSSTLHTRYWFSCSVCVPVWHQGHSLYRLFWTLAHCTFKSLCSIKKGILIPWQQIGAATTILTVDLPSEVCHPGNLMLVNLNLPTTGDILSNELNDI